MFDTIRQMSKNYYDFLPNQIVNKVGISAIFSFTVTVFLTKSSEGILDIKRPLFSAGISATASMIHAVTAPIFKGIFDDLDGNIVVELSKMIVVTVVTSALVHSFSPTQNLTTFAIYSALSLNWIRSLFHANFQSIDNSEYIYLDVY